MSNLINYVRMEKKFTLYCLIVAVLFIYGAVFLWSVLPSIMVKVPISGALCFAALLYVLLAISLSRKNTPTAVR